MRTVERRNRQQVERDEGEVEHDPPCEHGLENSDRRPERRRRASKQSDEDDDEGTEQCDHQIGRHSRQRYDDVSAANVPIIARIHRHRFRASEHDGSAEHRRAGQHEERKDDRQVRVDVLDRIPAEPPRLECGAITLLQCGIAVCDLVRDHREEQDGCDQQDRLKSMQLGRARSTATPASQGCATVGR